MEHPVNGITSEVIHQLTLQEIDRVKQLQELSRNQSKKNTYPNTEELNTYLETKDKLTPKPVIPTIKERLMSKYR